jgi:hypothetical protein
MRTKVQQAREATRDGMFLDSSMRLAIQDYWRKLANPRVLRNSRPATSKPAPSGIQLDQNPIFGLNKPAFDVAEERTRRIEPDH